MKYYKSIPRSNGKNSHILQSSDLKRINLCKFCKYAAVSEKNYQKSLSNSSHFPKKDKFKIQFLFDI